MLDVGYHWNISLNWEVGTNPNSRTHPHTTTTTITTDPMVQLNACKWVVCSQCQVRNTEIYVWIQSSMIQLLRACGVVRSSLHPSLTIPWEINKRLIIIIIKSGSNLETRHFVVAHMKVFSLIIVIIIIILFFLLFSFEQRMSFTRTTTMWLSFWRRHHHHWGLHTCG